MLAVQCSVQYSNDHNVAFFRFDDFNCWSPDVIDFRLAISWPCTILLFDDLIHPFQCHIFLSFSIAVNKKQTWKMITITLFGGFSCHSIKVALVFLSVIVETTHSTEECCYKSFECGGFIPLIIIQIDWKVNQRF